MGNNCDSKVDDGENLEALDVEELQRSYEEPRPTGNHREVKILLLGAAESGKTTLLKQMKIIHLQGFSVDERLRRREAVYWNIFSSVEELHTGLTKMGFTLDEGLEEDFRIVLEIAARSQYLNSISEDIIHRLIKIYRHRKIAIAFARRHEFQLNEAIVYFFQHLKRIAAPGYIPSDEDILWTRVQSIGVQKVEYIYRNFKFEVFDVPGQRSHRRKWIHFFDRVNAVIFVVAISEYDQKLREDDATNRVSEALDLFDSCINSMYLRDKQPIVFFNKIDLFKEKVNRVPIQDYFEEYKGPKYDFEKGIKFFEKAFASRIKSNRNDRKIYLHLSCATDTNQIYGVLNTAADKVLETAFQSIGLI